MKEYCKTLRVQASKDMQTRGRVESLTYLVTTVINLILKRNLSQVEKKFLLEKATTKVSHRENDPNLSRGQTNTHSYTLISTKTYLGNTPSQ